ncbi:MAG: PfkB family carbohydrate kinase, partial [Candidatus Hodarchaeota archaeon]
MANILCLGEILIDMIAKNRNLKSFNRRFGGSTANIAMQLVKFGHNISFAGTIGMDCFGDFLANVLESNSIDTKLLNKSEKHNTSIIFIVEDSETPVFCPYRDADYHYIFTPELKKTLSQIDLLHTSAFSLTRQPMRKTVLEALKIAKAQNKLVSIEPNFRKLLAPNDPNAQSVVIDALKYADIVKPSLDDSKAIFGNSLSPTEIVKKFEALNIKNIVLTCGKDGAYYLEKGKVEHDYSNRRSARDKRHRPGPSS